MIELLESLVRGVGLGGMYALIAVGFVIIYRATGVLNFAQPIFMILGTYISFTIVDTLGLPFPVGVAGAIIAVAAIAMGCERAVMRPMVGRPPFAAALVTIGLFAAGLVVTAKLFGPSVITSGDPWGLGNFCIGGERPADAVEIPGIPLPCQDGLAINYTDIFKIVTAAVVIGLLGAWLARSRYGLAMRATAMDQEAAMAQGISAGRIFSLSWAIAGALAAVGGILVGTAAGGVAAAAALVALKALPAIIIGGLDSIKGAVIGGLIVGVAEALTKTYQPDAAPWLGANFDVVMPYVLMFVVLLVQPYGLYGTKEVQRV
ncbi:MULTISPECIES: branched-chain amino acid ABC transporter permease [Antrihabitans]|uniref:Branched-chain amino acid ABC transporter permease n=2 Tax=Antrihabitans TaxID=2799491 RepID=A0A934NN74_9NOCA|nr:branched-chain amino acid ABC transporter permease [Antrihabitans stalagmiti]MBJ8338289.1 branched-chain amino acid ABC transporter permease [Antrihabitans stalagmiti]